MDYIQPSQIPKYKVQWQWHFMEGSIVKYIVRWRDKGGFQDLEKIKQYVDLLIEMEKKYVKPIWCSARVDRNAVY